MGFLEKFPGWLRIAKVLLEAQQMASGVSCEKLKQVDFLFASARPSCQCDGVPAGERPEDRGDPRRAGLGRGDVAEHFSAAAGDRVERFGGIEQSYHRVRHGFERPGQASLQLLRDVSKRARLARRSDFSPEPE